jgi:hypothetical protein
VPAIEVYKRRSFRNLRGQQWSRWEVLRKRLRNITQTYQPGDLELIFKKNHFAILNQKEIFVGARFQSGCSLVFHSHRGFSPGISRVLI